MLVSVVIPCYNVETFVSDCLNSVLGQTYQKIEILCIDNNSSDNTWEIMQAFQNEYSGKIRIFKEPKKGAPAARNKGLWNARGEWIQFLDADDLLLPQKIEHQVTLLKNAPEAGFVAGSYNKIALNGVSKTIRVKTGEFFKALFVSGLGITSANLFRKQLIQEAGGWNENYLSSQEAELMFRMIKNKAIVIVDDEPLTLVCERESGQISQRNPIEKWEQYISLRLSMIDYFKIGAPELFQKEKQFFYQNLFSFVRTLAKYDLEKAEDIYKKAFDQEFVPESNSFFSFYALLFKLCGFRKAEQLYKCLNT